MQFVATGSNERLSWQVLGMQEVLCVRNTGDTYMCVANRQSRNECEWFHPLVRRGAPMTIVCTVSSPPAISVNLGSLLVNQSSTIL